MQTCQDFLNGKCHRANCRYQHQARPDGTMPEQLPPPTMPKFVPPVGLDETLFDPVTGFGLFGQPTYGTRFGSGALPIIKAEDTRPVCIEFFNSGRCTRRGPHGQTCMYRHVSKDDPNKVDHNAPKPTAASKVPERPALPIGWVSETSKRHPILPSQKADETALAAAVAEWIAAKEQRAREEAKLVDQRTAAAAELAAAAAERATARAAAAEAAADGAPAGEAALGADDAAGGDDAAEREPTEQAPLLTTASVDAAAQAEYEQKYAAWYAHNQAYLAQQAAHAAGAPQQLPYAMGPPGHGAPPGAMRMPMAPPRPSPY